jgi:hypothetical protein
MRAKDITEICEDIEDFAAAGRKLTENTYPEAEVAVTEDNRRLLTILGLLWGMRA